jgi:hypothetical protein
MAAATERAEARHRALADTRRAGRAAVRDAERVYRSGRRLTDDEAAWLGVLLVDIGVRDYAWQRCAGEDWRVGLWTDLLRRMPPRYVPAPAGLLAFTAWRQGQGALASAAVDRALEAEPHYSMAQLLGQVLDEGMSPEVLDEPEWTPRPARVQHRRDRRGARRRAHGRTIS